MPLVIAILVGLLLFSVLLNLHYRHDAKMSPTSEVNLKSLNDSLDAMTKNFNTVCATRDANFILFEKVSRERDNIIISLHSTTVQLESERNARQSLQIDFDILLADHTSLKGLNVGVKETALGSALDRLLKESESEVDNFTT